MTVNHLSPETFIFFTSIQYFPKYVFEILDHPEKILSFYEEIISEMAKKNIIKKGNEKDRLQLEEFQEFIKENYFRCKLIRLNFFFSLNYLYFKYIKFHIINDS
jgi:hypothetical protein